MKLVGTCIILNQEEAKKVFEGFSATVEKAYLLSKNPETKESVRNEASQFVKDNYPILKEYCDLTHPPMKEKGS